MKKLITFVSVSSILALSFLSCTKTGNYTCTCTIKVGTTVDETYSFPYTSVTKSAAEKGCKDVEAAQQSSLASSSPGSTASCSLD